jgi:hypothetical protein
MTRGQRIQTGMRPRPEAKAPGRGCGCHLGDDRESVGIILCADRDEAIAKLALHRADRRLDLEGGNTAAGATSRRDHRRGARGPPRPVRTRHRPHPIDRASRPPQPGDRRWRRLTARPPHGHWFLARKPVERAHTLRGAAAVGPLESSAHTRRRAQARRRHTLRTTRPARDFRLPPVRAAKR